MVHETLKKTQFKYICEKCNFKSNNKNDYRRHLQTKKHNGTYGYMGGTQKTHKCICGKSYVYLQGLYRHRNTCETFINSQQIVLDKNVQIDKIIEKYPDKNIIINNYYDNKVTNSNNNMNNNNNNSFSVKNYLNTECKDAFTVKQVLDNFQCDIMKLPSKPIPFYKDIVDKAFFNIPIHKLPIRCSDIKRKTFYGHNKQWDKNFDVVKEFIMKLVDTICDFRKIFVNNNPTWIENDLTTDILGSVITNISKVYDEQTVKKIVQHISERTKIDK